MNTTAKLRPLAALAPAALAVLLAFGGACSRPGGSAGETTRGREATARDAGGATRARAAEPSLFELAFPLTDAEGRTRRMAELRGEPFVASMIYTSCRSVCPRITADLKSLEQALPGEVRARTRFVLFSLDPERDTPAALRRFAAEHALDPARWTLLAAGPDDMRTLAAVLGVRFRPDGGGEIAHSAVIVVVDSAGVIRHRQAGMRNDTRPLVAALESAWGAPGGPVR